MQKCSTADIWFHSFSSRYCTHTACKWDRRVMPCARARGPAADVVHRACAPRSHETLEVTKGGRRFAGSRLIDTGARADIESTRPVAPAVLLIQVLVPRPGDDRVPYRFARPLERHSVRGSRRIALSMNARAEAASPTVSRSRARPTMRAVHSANRYSGLGFAVLPSFPDNLPR
jgi:hypothetical protein